jgi:site-specific recombinase XerC
MNSFTLRFNILHLSNISQLRPAASGRFLSLDTAQCTAFVVGKASKGSIKKFSGRQVDKMGLLNHGGLMDSNTRKTKIVGPWNKGRLVGQKLPLKLREIWAIRIRLQLAERCRDLALFNLAIDSKLRGCDLVSLRVKDISQGRSIFHRAIVMQRKTSRPVQFEITEQTRQSVLAWIDRRKLSGSQFLFPSRVSDSPHLSTRQYARIVTKWVESIGLDSTAYGTHSMRRTKATLIYRRTKNLRAVQLLLGHTKLESTIRYLGIEVDDALEIAEQTEV